MYTFIGAFEMTIFMKFEIVILISYNNLGQHSYNNYTNCLFVEQDNITKLDMYCIR